MAKTPVDVTTNEQRIIGIGSFIWLWFGMTAQMGVFNLGASFVFRIPFSQVVIAILLGNIVIAILLVLNGDAGSKWGIKFAVFLKSQFGYKGFIIPCIARAIGATCWFGIQTFFGATAINLAIKYLTGYDNWFIYFIAFGAVQIALAYMGITWIKWLQNLAAPALLVLSIWLIFFLSMREPDNTFTNFLAAEIGDNPLPFWAALTANLSYWVTVAINISDFTRFQKTDNSKKYMKRNRVSAIGQIPGITIGMIVFVSVGMVGAYYTGFANPVEIVNASLGGAWVLLGLFIILLAQLSTNVAANLFATANVLSIALAPWGVNYKKGVLIAGGIGMFTMPWLLVEHFLVYLPFLGALLAPLPAIMIMDYYLFRKTTLSVPDLFDSEGRYNFAGGFNPAAIIAYVCGVAVGATFLRASWLVALPVALLVYYVLMKLWTQKKYPEAYSTEGIEELEYAEDEEVVRT